MTETLQQPAASIPLDVPIVGPEAALSPAAAAPGVSGVYTYLAGTAPGGGTPVQPTRADVRLDVDGRHPLRTASGEIRWGSFTRVHWVASLQANGTNRWKGQIWYKNGAQQMLPHTRVEIQALSSPRRLRVRFGGSFAGAITLTCPLNSVFFRPLELEIDRTPDANPVLSIRTADHPNRPASLAAEELSIPEIFRRAGFEVRSSGGDGQVPLSIAAGGISPRWSNAEMHDAMQVHWSRFADRAQWSLWVFFAALHDDGPRLGGIMFDYTGARQRQGTAIFTEAFIKNPPAGDPAGTAWVRRMRFWCACHEMGHAFNLAHSWDKGSPDTWIPMSAAPEDRSFMNYPYNVLGGQARFFSDFEFRFSDKELLFMRHAPERFVQMGNVAWGDHHAAEQETDSGLKLTLRVNRANARFQFMEPVVCELKLTNVTDEPMLVSPDVLKGQMDVIVQRDGVPGRRVQPLARFCWKSPRTVLPPGESLYETLFIPVDRDGWLIAEPGWYTALVGLRVGEHDVVSNPLRLRVDPPAGYDEELVAQDLFTGDVGRVLAFDGSRVLQRANDTLREVVERFPNRSVAAHARVALAAPLVRPHKVIIRDPETIDADDRGAIGVLEEKPELARRELEEGLMADPNAAAQSLAHKDFHDYVDLFCNFLADAGDPQAAAQAQQVMLDIFKRRGVKPSVLSDIARKRDAFARGERPETEADADCPA